MSGSEAQLARRAANLLAQDAERQSSTVLADDDAMIAAIALAIRDEASKRWRRRIALAVGSTGVIAAAVIGIAISAHAPGAEKPGEKPGPIAQVSPLVEGATIVKGNKSVAVERGSSIREGERIVCAHSARATMTLATGTHLVAEEDADLAVVTLGQQQSFELRAGAVRADVSKLHPSENFVIRTRDAEVEVRGTSFRVAIVDPDPKCGAGTITRVSVTEGDVVVRRGGHEQHVLGGQAWPKCMHDTPTSAPLLPPPPVSATPKEKPAPAPVPSTSGEASKLAGQTALFAEANAARRRGDAALAIARYEELARRYPTSDLAESALVERMRLLAIRDERLAGVAAQEYLARYPSGFARDEATRLANKGR